MVVEAGLCNFGKLKVGVEVRTGNVSVRYAVADAVW
jgi:hypothetical protein